MSEKTKTLDIARPLQIAPNVGGEAFSMGEHSPSSIVERVTREKSSRGCAKAIRNIVEYNLMLAMPDCMEDRFAEEIEKTLLAQGKKGEK